MPACEQAEISTTSLNLLIYFDINKFPAIQKEISLGIDRY
jgi:hypothetical protein